LYTSVAPANIVFDDGRCHMYRADGSHHCTEIKDYPNIASEFSNQKKAEMFSVISKCGKHQVVVNNGNPTKLTVITKCRLDALAERLKARIKNIGYTR